MPFRLDAQYGPPRAKVQFVTFAAMPSMIYEACVKTGITSNTVYIQRAVCEALARDLGMDVEDLYGMLPSALGNAKRLRHGPRLAEDVK